MRATQHRSNNDVLRAPPGSTIDECRALAITRIVYADGTPALTSYWQPSPNELRLLTEVRPVRIVVLGHTHPPISIGVKGDGGDA